MKLSNDINATKQVKFTRDHEFDVFISYSRLDIAFARALEKALKEYHPPKDLPVPYRYIRVFRDENDFMGTDYSKAIQDHLKKSSKLIVICSPNSYASKYVNNEIRIFKHYHDVDSIIPVLIDGLPNNETNTSNTIVRAYPEALCEAISTPLGADYRGYAAGKPRVRGGAYEGAWFKLLADFYGLSRNVIEKREKQRQLRLRRRWIGGASTIMAALSVLTVWALVSRAEAVKQREIATSGLVAARARAQSGPEPEVVERQALLALESLENLERHGGDTNDAFDVLSAAVGHLPQRLIHFRPQGRPPNITFATDGLTFYRAVGGRLEAWSTRPLRTIWSSNLPEVVSQIIPDPSNRLLAIIDSEGAVRFLDASNGSPALESHIKGQTPVSKGAVCGTFNNDGTLFAAVVKGDGMPRQVVVWRPTNVDSPARLILPLAARGEITSSPCIFTIPSIGFDNASAGTIVTSYRRSVGTDSEVDTVLAWALPPNLLDQFAGIIWASPNIHLWSHVTGAAAFGVNETMILTRERIDAANCTLLCVPDGWEVLSINTSDWSDKRIAALTTRSGSVSRNGSYFLTHIDTTEDPIVPLLKTQRTYIRDTIDASVKLELPTHGRFISSGSEFISYQSRLVRIWHITAGEEVYRFLADRPIESVVDAPGSRYVVTIHNDNSAALWDTAHPQEMSRVANSTYDSLDDISSVINEQTSDSLHLARSAAETATAKGSIYAESEGYIKSPHKARVMGPLPKCWFSSTFGCHFGWDEGTITRLFDPKEPGTAIWQATGISGARFSPDGSILLVVVKNGEGQKLVGLSADTGSQIWERRFRRYSPNFTFLPDGRSLIHNIPPRDETDIGEVHVLDLNTGISRVTLSGGATTLYGSDRLGKKLAVVQPDRILISDLEMGKKIQEIRLPETLNDVDAIRFSPNGDRLVGVLGSKASTFFGPSTAFYTELAVFVWDVATGRQIARVPPGTDAAGDYPETLQEEEKAYLANAVLSEDGTKLGATVFPSRLAYWGTTSSRVRRAAIIWDLNQPLPVQILRVPELNLKDVSSHLALLSDDDSSRVWELSRVALRERACDRLSRNLTLDEWKEYFGLETYRMTCERASD